MWELFFTKQAQEDSKKLAAANLKEKAEKLLQIIREDPFSTNPSYEKLVGNYKNVYSRRINIKHRLVYTVDKKTKFIKILRLWSHYE